MSNDLKDFTLNRFPNPNAQFSVGNLVAFADAAGTAPVDGTGGSPNSTITRTESSPLEGVASFLFTKNSGASRQGEGFSADIVLQPSDATKVMRWSFDYQITTGTYTGYQTGSSFSDITLWVYDVTNSVMYQATPYQLDGTVSTTNQYDTTVEWQVPVGCLQARLIWFIGNSTNSAFTAKFSNIQFGRKERAIGSIMTAGASYAATWQGFGTVSNSYAQWSRFGANALVQARWQNGTVGATTAAMVLPFTVDSALGNTATIVGSLAVGNTSATANFNVFALGGTNTVFFTRGNVFVPLTASSVFNNSELMSCSVVVPVLGWGANGTLGQDADTRVVAARYSIGATLVTANNGIIDYSARTYDTHSAVTSGISWGFFAPVAGIYEVGIQLSQGQSTIQVDLFKNNAFYQRFFSENVFATNPNNGFGSVSLSAGDVLNFRNTSGATIVMGLTTQNWITINRLSGPAQVQAPEMISARYSTNAGQSIPGTGAVTLVDFEDRTFDSHGCVTTGASWKFTCPRAGVLRVSAKLRLASDAGWNVGEGAAIYIYKNGAEYCRQEFFNTAAVTEEINLLVTDLIQCVAGDYIDVRISQSSGGSIALSTNGIFNSVAIEYVAGF